MIALLIVALSVPGMAAAWALLKPMPPRAWDVPVDDAEPDGAQFGFDSRGIYS